MQDLVPVWSQPYVITLQGLSNWSNSKLVRSRCLALYVALEWRALTLERDYCHPNLKSGGEQKADQ